jgi:hypothetical protein
MLNPQQMGYKALNVALFQVRLKQLMGIISVHMNAIA